LNKSRSLNVGLRPGIVDRCRFLAARWPAVIVVVEQLVYRYAKHVCDPNCHIDRRCMSVVFDGIHGLPADANAFGEPLLRHFAVLEPELANVVG